MSSDIFYAYNGTSNLPVVLAFVVLISKFDIITNLQ